MRRHFFFAVFLVLLLGIPLASQAASTQTAPWQWLVDEVASGKEVIQLPGNIVRDNDTGLFPEGTVRIEGNGYTITDALVDGGTVIFKDIEILGDHGVRDEIGGPALTIRGDGAIVMLTGWASADGGPSGPTGETGGDGILMTGNHQGLILNNTASAKGGAGRIFGGAGVRVTGCENSLLVTDSASLVGNGGIGIGGAGLIVPSCCKATFEETASITGGISQHDGGHGVQSLPCEACDVRGVISFSGMTMAIGAVGDTGGDGIRLLRGEAGELTDLILADSSMLLAGDGATAGAALRAEYAAIEITGEVLAYGGSYFATETPALSLENCTVTGDEIAVTEGAQTETYPARNASVIIRAAVGQQSGRYAPVVIEDGLVTQDLVTKLNGFTVDKGTTNQVKISGNSLKIYMFNGTYDKRLSFKQGLMSDGAEGTRLVLIASVSDEWPTMEGTVAGLRKLLSIGVTELAYTCVAPVYHDRILDLASLLAAIDAYGEEIPKIICGTADDAIIFVQSNGAWDYQEGLMQEVRQAADE